MNRDSLYSGTYLDNQPKFRPDIEAASYRGDRILNHGIGCFDNRGTAVKGFDVWVCITPIRGTTIASFSVSRPTKTLNYFTLLRLMVCRQ